MALTSAADLRPVLAIAAKLQELLQQSRSIQPTNAVECPLASAEIIPHIDTLYDDTDIEAEHDPNFRFATVETAARDLFYALISSADIEDPAFVDVWHLLDILLLCGDRGKCAPELTCWLIEELLESQTTHGCRIVFDYLESRRERLAQKDFHRKNLIFLRMCNELLRRLSKAEDAIFCGRVFFFLFQTFPLGDKSSVNLRGEFHVENTTKYDSAEAAKETDAENMEVDAEASVSEQSTSRSATPVKGNTPQPPTRPGSKAIPIKAPRKIVEEEVLDSNTLYPIFWRLQQDFCEPTRLFSADHFKSFTKGLGQTITKFKKTPTVVQTKSGENGKRGTKRKLDEDAGDEDASSGHSTDNYNPKYLTSRELFDLELTDLAFQRHILVQALILIDFLLSLTERSKKRLAAVEATNKSMLYQFTLSEENTKWALATRATIKSSLQTTTDGRFYDRMVETVLARDKNWVRWKIESCPSIVRDAVSTEQELDARAKARAITRPRRIPERTMGAMDLSFLEEGHGGGLDILKDSNRHHAPSVEQLLDGIKTDQLDLEMAFDDAEKESIENMIQNKTWKALRQARVDRLSLLNKIAVGSDIELIFRPSEEKAEEKAESNGLTVVAEETAGLTEATTPPSEDKLVGEVLAAS